MVLVLLLARSHSDAAAASFPTVVFLPTTTVAAAAAARHNIAAAGIGRVRSRARSLTLGLLRSGIVWANGQRFLSLSSVQLRNA